MFFNVQNNNRSVIFITASLFQLKIIDIIGK